MELLQVEGVNINQIESNLQEIKNFVFEILKRENPEAYQEMISRGENKFEDSS